MLWFLFFVLAWHSHSWEEEAWWTCKNTQGNENEEINFHLTFLIYLSISFLFLRCSSVIESLFLGRFFSDDSYYPPRSCFEYLKLLVSTKMLLVNLIKVGQHLLFTSLFEKNGGEVLKKIRVSFTFVKFHAFLSWCF